MKNILTVIMILATGCSLGFKKTLTAQPTPPTAEPYVDINSFILGVGARDFIQTFRNMGVVTGQDTSTVTAGGAALNTTFNNLKNNLMSPSVDIRTVNATLTIAQTNLAVAMCDNAWNGTNGTDRNLLFPGTTTNSFPVGAKTQVITALLQRFTLSPTPSAEEISILSSLYDDLKAGGVNDLGLGVGLCTAALASVKASVFN